MDERRCYYALVGESDSYSCCAVMDIPVLVATEECRNLILKMEIELSQPGGEMVLPHTPVGFRKPCRLRTFSGIFTRNFPKKKQILYVKM